MRAIRVHKAGGPNELKLESGVPIPEPSKTQVLVRVKAVGVNPIDAVIRSGQFGPQPYPYIPGLDGAGVVEKVGSDVKSHKVGDRVYIYGKNTYAELTVAEEKRTFSLPANVTFEQGAALGVPYFTAYRALVTKGHLKKGQTVLIHGASGGVGVGALQIAKDLGATVIGTASSPEGLKLIGQYGTAFNHRQNGYEKEIAAKFPHINLIIEVLANVNIGKDLELIGHGGTIVIIGCRGLGQNVPLANTMMKEVEIRGLTLYAATDADCQETGTYITAGLQKGVLVPIVAEKFSFDKAADAHEKVMGEVKAPGKLVLIP